MIKIFKTNVFMIIISMNIQNEKILVKINNVLIVIIIIIVIIG